MRPLRSRKKWSVSGWPLLTGARYGGWVSAVDALRSECESLREALNAADHMNTTYLLREFSWTSAQLTIGHRMLGVRRAVASGQSAVDEADGALTPVGSGEVLTAKDVERHRRRLMVARAQLDLALAELQRAMDQPA